MMSVNKSLIDKLNTLTTEELKNLDKKLEKEE